MEVGIGVRTLAEWLARGRAGQTPFAGWVGAFEAAEEHERRTYCDWRWKQERARAKERWQRFKAQRIQWHLETIGPEEFWRRRLIWLLGQGKTRAFEATAAWLVAEGFRMKDTP
jgi:hypothetical protein